MGRKCVIITMTLTLFIFVALGTAVLAFGPSNETIYKGIDVSEWQGNIDFKKVKEDGIKVVYIRAGQGFGYKDEKFERNYKEAKKYDLKVGVYHYVTARSEEEAKRQARFFVSLISGKKIDCKLAMDFEHFPNLSKSEINKISIAFLEEVEKVSGKKAVVYSDAYNANHVFEGEVAKYPLWIAQYGVEKPENNGRWKYWEGFQYTSKGKVAGIRGNVDRDKFTKDILLDDTSEVPSTDKPDHKGEERFAYRIKKGDTLSELASKYSTTVRDLVYLNNIKNPNLIYIEQKIIISANRINDTKTTYRVKWGDTLSEIAKKYHTTVEHLVDLNKIKNKNLIYAGEMILI